MAAQAENIAPKNLIATFQEAVGLLTKARELRARNERTRVAAEAEGTMEVTEYDPKSLASVLITALNGYTELPEQRVIVEYLRTDQKLRLPYILGMSGTSTGTGDAQRDDVLLNRYHKLSSFSYSEMYQWMVDMTPYTAIRTAVDAAEPGAMTAKVTTWTTQNYYTRPGVARTSDEERTAVFTYASHALQFNCDVRDMGFTLTTAGRTADNAWMDITKVTKDTFIARVYPFTLLRIAALNYVPCGNSAIASWVRAYGVALGMLPDLTSKHRTEYVYVKSQPPKASQDAVSDYEQGANFDIRLLCVNLLSMFGLLHLAKDHTYKPHEPNMVRISESYLKALRTGISEDVLTKLIGDMEATCRTGAHPFGLGQTYYMAHAAAKMGYLASPLAIRIDVTPPPVQRVMIALAASREWGSLPVGKELNELHAPDLAAIRAEEVKIMRSPAAYSGLHRMYGIDTMQVIAKETKDALDSMMPLVYGFAMSQHIDDTNKKDGIALAMSLTNVNRDTRAMASMFTTLWENYVTGMDQVGLLDYARQGIIRPAARA